MRKSLISKLDRAALNLFPGYFAMVMATGAASIASSLLSMGLVAMILLGINTAFYLALVSLTLVRLLRHAGAFIDDMRNHARGPGFFTIVAGTCILASQYLIVLDAQRIAVGLWGFAAALWVVITYWFFVAVVVRPRKPNLEKGINGAWLLASVATQALSVLTALIPWPEPISSNMLFLALSLHLIGAMLYLAIIPLIFYRLTFLRLEMSALTPPYWINMGAVAIATLAGSTLLLASDGDLLLGQFRSFVTGFTVFFWAAASWWIPLLIGLTAWRHLVARFPLEYDPQYWGMVFPLAMYTTGSLRLMDVLDLEFLRFIPATFIWLALSAWLATVFGMFRYLLKANRKPT